MKLNEIVKDRPAFSENVGQVAWDASAYDTYAACPRKYYYSILLGWRPKVSNVHLTFGSYAAQSLAHFFSALASGMHREDALLSTVKLAMNISRGWYSADTKKNRRSLFRLLVWYADHYKADPMKVAISPEGKALAECSFAVPLDDEFLWCGTVDQVVDLDGMFFVRDQKTTGSSLGANYFKQWDLSNQMTGYAFASKVVFDAVITGVVIDSIQVAVTFFRFERYITMRTPDQIAEWRSEVLNNMYRARAQFQHALDKGVTAFPRNVTACGNYGGCQFRSVCSRAPSVRQQFLNADFERVYWDPTTGTANAVTD